MKLDRSTRTVIAVLLVFGLAVAFWMLLLAPKRQQADDLGARADRLRAELSRAEGTVAAAEAARQQFSRNYRQLVVLGKAVPADDETSSLLVQLNHVANRSDVRFESLELGTENGSASTASAEGGGSGGGGGEQGGEQEPSEESGEGSAGVPAATVTPTEAAASLQPIGATVGPAGLAILPYDLTFRGSFFHVADFIEGIDSMVHTRSAEDVAVDGRLVTLDGFALNGDGEKGFPSLEATFSVTTYLAPPDQGIAAGASEEAPAETTPTSTSTGTNAR